MGDLSKLCKVGQLGRVVQATYLTHQVGMPLSSDIIYYLLQGCTENKNLTVCRQVHALMISSRFATCAILGDHLIRLFALCGSLLEANLVFYDVEKPSVFTWHAIIFAHATLEESHGALDLYYQMQHKGMIPSKFIFLCILKVCSSIGALGQVRLIHGQVIASGMGSDVVVESTLLDVYAKCGNLEDARKVFDEMHNRNVVSWGAMIAGYAQNGHGLCALELYEELHHEGIIPDKVVFSCILQACSSIGAIGQGRLIHDKIMRSGLESNVVLGNGLIDMYAKCGSLGEAHTVFDDLSNRTLVSWGSMIAGYANHGHGVPAFELLWKMQQEGIKPSKFTFSSILKACGRIGALRNGRVMHDQIIRSGLDSNLIIGNTLIDMYVKCGSLEDAYKVFDLSPNRDEVSWGAMMAGCAQLKDDFTAFELFTRMHLEGTKPNNFTFSCALHSCSSIGAMEEGKLIHDEIIKSGLESDAIVGSALVDIYVKCGSLKEANKLFDDLPHRNIASWGALIAGYVQQDHGLLALQLFNRMQVEHIKPNLYLFSSALKACLNVGAIEQGRMIHGQMINSGLELDAIVGNTLIDMYAKCGDLEAASRVFDDLSSRDVVTWNSIIAGYTQHGHGQSALEIFSKMQQDGVKPDRVTFLCILQACGSTGAIGQGRSIHDQIMNSRIELDVPVENALVDMYASLDSIEDSYRVFARLPNPDVISWGAIITGYAQRGNCQLIEQCLEDMRQQGVMPDSRIFTSIIAACHYKGQVDEGHRYFKIMRENYGIIASVEHFNCMVDLLARAGHLNEAEKFLETMPGLPDVTSWTSLLTACRTYGNVQLGRKCFDQVISLDPSYAAGYVLMSVIYTDAQLWDDVHKIQELKKCNRAWKKPGRSSLEVDKKMQKFIVGEKILLQSVDVHVKVNGLRKRMELDGYVPILDLVLEPI